MSAAIDGTTDTPRTDSIVREVVDAMVGAGALWDHVVPAEFARQLERELAEAKKPPPCRHHEIHGKFWSDGRAKQWCAICGADMPINRFTGAVNVFWPAP